LAGVAALAALWGWNNVSRYLDHFSFVGGLLTVVGLIVAIGEIINTGRTSSLIEAALVKDEQVTARKASATAIGEVLNALDDTNREIQGARYAAALRAVQSARQSLRRIDTRMFGDASMPSSLGDRFNSVEMSVQIATHATPDAPLTPAQRNKLCKAVCDIKTAIEEIERKGVIG